MEAPLLIVPRNKEDQASAAHYGSTGNNQDVRTAKHPGVHTRKDQDAGTRVTQANATRSKRDKSIKTSQATRPTDGQDVIIAVNPDAWEAYRRIKRRYKFSSWINNFTLGLLNFALLIANVSQLKLITALDGGDPCFDLLVIATSLSIILEIVAAALMVYIGTLDMNNDQRHEKYETLIAAVAMLAYVITHLNYATLAFVR